MIRRSAAVSIAVTFQYLASGQVSNWTPDQELVLQALRRSKTSLNQAPDQELSEYVQDLSPLQIGGVISNVKGIFHEMLVEKTENIDGDLVSAQLFEETNHPGADIEFLVDGNVIYEVQLKAVQDPAAILDHFSKYPEIDVMATSEVFMKMGDTFEGRLFNSEISNNEISQTTRETFEELAGEDLGELLQDGLITSILVGGALSAKAVLSGQQEDAKTVRSFLEMGGVSVGTALAIDTLLNLV